MNTRQPPNPLASLSRRRFLQGSAALAAATALPTRSLWAAEGRILKVRNYGEFNTLDPAFAANLYEETISACLYSKLISYRPGNTWDWQPDAAETIEQIDPTHIRFTLRPGIQFTNGFGEMTAEDVKFSFERIIDPALDSPIKGDWDVLDHVEVIDRYTGIIVLKTAFQPVWKTTLPYMAGNIVSRKAVESVGGKYTTEPPCVSGPYVIKEWKPKQRTVLVRNPQWNGPAPDFDEIQIFPIDDESTAEIAFEAGDIDFTQVSAASFPQYRSTPPAGATLVNFPSLYYMWLGMNVDNPALQDARVRKAIQLAIDLPSIMEAAYFGIAEPATGIIPPGLIGHRPQPLVPAAADMDAARRLLEESGQGGNLSLTLDVLNKATWVSTAQVIQAFLGQIGIQVQINLHESGAFWSLGDDKQGERWKDVQLILNRFSSAPDPYYATQWFTQPQVGVWNWERFRSDEFDSLHEAAKQEADAGKRDQMYQRMQDLMEESGAYRFITHDPTPTLYRNSVIPALRPDGVPLLRYFRKA